MESDGDSQIHGEEAVLRPHLYARVDSVKLLVSLLQPLHTLRADKAVTININESGFRVSVENDSKTLYAVAYVRSVIFREYKVEGLASDDEGSKIDFSVNLASVMDCLQMFGAANMHVTTLDLEYSELDRRLNLVLQWNGLVVDCSLATMEAHAQQSLVGLFGTCDRVGSAVASPQLLCDSFQEVIDLEGAGTIALTMSPEAPFFRLESQGNSGSVTVDIPASSSVWSNFEPTAETRHTYKASTVAEAIRAVGTADQTYLRINTAGMLSINHRMVDAGGEQVFVSFTLLPEEELEEGQPRVDELDRDDDDEVRLAEDYDAALEERKRGVAAAAAAAAAAEEEEEEEDEALFGPGLGGGSGIGDE